MNFARALRPCVSSFLHPEPFITPHRRIAPKGAGVTGLGVQAKYTGTSACSQYNVKPCACVDVKDACSNEYTK